jgi:hypothetical protein
MRITILTKLSRTLLQRNGYRKTKQEDVYAKRRMTRAGATRTTIRATHVAGSLFLLESDERGEVSGHDDSEGRTLGDLRTFEEYALIR